MNGDALHDLTVDRYAEYLNPGLSRLMAFAGFGTEVFAEGCWITDHEGKRYLDCLGGYGVFSLGHRHPRVIQAVKDQLDRIPLSGKAFFNARQAELAEALAKLAPGDLKYTFFCNSGAEAVEAALKLAKGATGRPHLLSTEGGYHGKTLGALATTGREKYRKPFAPLMPGVQFVPFGDAEAARRALTEETAAMIVEPIQGEGGILLPPDGYLRELRAACDAVGALLIFDEVQTGLGRTGTWFGCDHDGVAPDLLTLAKALGGGVMPIGAVIGTPDVWEKVYGQNPLLHTSTFGGNELACAAGLATLEVLAVEGLIENSRAMGARLLAGLQAVQQANPKLIKEVRGRGLMVGVEMQMDEVGELTVAQMLPRGICAAYTLNNPRVMRFEPPLNITADEVDLAVRLFGEAISATDSMLSEMALL